MSVPTQERRTVVTDWKHEYGRLVADEVTTMSNQTAWNWGWTHGRAFGLREAGVELALVEEVVHRLVLDAHVRRLTADLSKSIPLTELVARRYPGDSPVAVALRARVEVQAASIRSTWAGGRAA